MPLVLSSIPKLAGLGLAYFLAAALALKAFGTLSPVWYANAIALVALLRSRPRGWPALLAVAWLADIAAFWLFGQGPPLLLSFCDIAEIALAALVIRRSGGVRSPLFEGSTMGRLIVVCLAVPVLSAALGAGVLVLAQDENFLAAWRAWYSAAALGLVIAAPFLLSWSDPQLRRKGVEQLTLAPAAALVAAAAFAAFLVYQHNHAALLFLSFPVVFALTWVYGLTGATAGVLAVMVSALAAAVVGPRDVFTALMPAARLEQRVEAVQLYLVAILFCSLPLAVLRTRQQDLQRRLRRAGQARTEFLAAMSHEIRTPMTGVLGMADLLTQEPLTGRQRQYVEAMRASGRHLLSVINDILDFSRIEGGKLELECIDFSLRESVETVQSVMHPVAVERGLELKIEIEVGPVDAVQGDPLRLRQVLLNLVGNAIKFTERGAVTLRIAQRPRPEPGRLTVVFEVRDTGIGIEPARLAQLFSPFVQADTSTARQYGGTGLGLAISKQLVEAMGGTIGAASEPGAGSSFYFELPLQVGGTGGRPAAAAAEPLVTAPRRILVAEDVEINRELLRAALEQQGHEAVFAPNGLAAFELARSESFDLVLMDVQMPVLDGVAATRRIRELPGPAGSVPIIGLTANVMDRERALYLDAGMDDCLGKPIDWPRLAAAIDRHGRRREQDRHAPAPPSEPPPEPLIEQRALEALQAIVKPQALANLMQVGIAGYAASAQRMARPGATDEEIRMEAHRVKGSAATLGLRQISAVAARLESGPGDGEIDRALVASLQDTIAQSRTELAARGLLAPD